MAVADYDPVIEAASQEWDVDPNWVRSIMQQESGGNPVRNGQPIVGSSGERGLMQIMPQTAASLGVQNPDDPVQNIWGGVRYLAQMRDQFHGNVPLATAAYNAGPERVNAFINNGTPLPASTSGTYVPAVSGNYQTYAKQHQSRAGAQTAPGVPTNDDFLKMTGGSAQPTNAIPSNDDFLKMTSGANPAAPAKAPSGTSPVDLAEGEGANPYDTGAPLPAGAGQGLISIGNAMVQGAERGFGPVTAANPIGISPQQESALRSAGIYGPTAGTGTPVQRFNEALINPLIAGGGLALRTLGGGVGAAQAGVAQAGTVAGQPLLGRELAALPEAFPAGVPEAGAALRGFADNPLVARPMARPNPLAVDVAPGGLVRNPLAVEQANPLAAPVNVISAPAFVPPGSTVPLAPRAAALIAEDQRIAGTAPPGVPPVGAVVRDPVTGAGAPVVQPANPLSTVSIVPHAALPTAANPLSTAPAAVPAVIPPAALPAAIPTTSAAAKAVASDLYARADAAGGQLSPVFTNRFLDHAESLAPQTPEGQAVAGNSELTALTQRMQTLRDQPISLQGAQEIDESLGNLIDKEYGTKGLSKDGKNLLDLQSSFRNMIRDAGPADVVGGTQGFDALTDARQAWAQAMKMDDLERIQTRASLTDNPATGIKSGIRTLLSNPSRARGYSPDEIAALKAAGDRGVVGGALHVFGSRLMPLATGAAGFGAEGPMSAILAAGATHLGSTVLRNAASGLQARRLNNALQVLGSKVPLQSP